MQTINFSKELKKQMIDDIKKYFLEERDEEIGDLAAGLFLDFITRKMGSAFYNQAIQDAHLFINEKLDDLYALEKHPSL